MRPVALLFAYGSGVLQPSSVELLQISITQNMRATTANMLGHIREENRGSWQLASLANPEVEMQIGRPVQQSPETQISRDASFRFDWKR